MLAVLPSSGPSNTKGMAAKDARFVPEIPSDPKSLDGRLRWTPSAEARILAAVDDLFEAQVRLTQDLVRFPSLRGQEHTIRISCTSCLGAVAR